MSVDLFPGESHTFDVAGDLEDIEPTQLTARPVLRSLTVPLAPEPPGRYEGAGPVLVAGDLQPTPAVTETQVTPSEPEAGPSQWR